MRYNIGQNVTLTEGYRGYKSGEIIGYDFPLYEVRGLKKSLFLIFCATLKQKGDRLWQITF